MYIGARDTGYMLVGMPFDRWMDIGMALIVAGLRRGSVRAGAALLAGQGVGVERARVHRPRFEPSRRGAHQAAARTDARCRDRHPEAVHLHLHPPRGRERIQPELADPPRARPLAGGALPVRRDRRHRARLADLGLLGDRSAAGRRSCSPRRSSSAPPCAARCPRSGRTWSPACSWA